MLILTHHSREVGHLLLGLFLHNLRKNEFMFVHCEIQMQGLATISVTNRKKQESFKKVWKPSFFNNI